MCRYLPDNTPLTGPIHHRLAELALFVDSRQDEIATGVVMESVNSDDGIFDGPPGRLGAVVDLLVTWPPRLDDVRAPRVALKSQKSCFPALAICTVLVNKLIQG